MRQWANFFLWSAAHNDKKEFAEATERLSDLVEAAIDRVKSELLESPQTDFQVFHVGRWHKTESMSADELHTFHTCTRLRLRRMCKLAEERSVEQALQQYFQVMPILHDTYKLRLREETKVPDNRELWPAAASKLGILRGRVVVVFIRFGFYRSRRCRV